MPLELSIDSSSQITLQGSVTVKPPSWMKVLPVDELKEAQSADNRDELVLAVGRDPSSEDIVFLTGDGKLWVLSLATQLKEGVPTLKCSIFPNDCGHTITFPLSDDNAYEIDAGWALDHATSIVSF